MPMEKLTWGLTYFDQSDDGYAGLFEVQKALKTADELTRRLVVAGPNHF